MKFITQGETPVINTNDNLEIVETDAQGNELVTLPTVTATPLPIIWLTNDVKTETIAAMIATEQYAIRIYADIKKDAADVPGYRRPLLLMEQIFLSLPGVDDERLLTNYDEHDPNDIEIPAEYSIAHDFCYEVFASTPLKESQEYDLHLRTLNINSPPYKPSSPTPSPVPVPAPIINVPVPPQKEKVKKDFGDICPKCRCPYKYDHVAWARGQTDGYTCRCKKDLAPPPSPPFIPLSPCPRTPSPKTTASEQANPTTVQPPAQRPIPYVNYDQFDRWVRDDTNYLCLHDNLLYQDQINAYLSDWKRLDNMETHLGEMQGRLDSAWDALETAQVKLESAKSDIQKTVRDFPLAFRGIVREKKRVCLTA